MWNHWLVSFQAAQLWLGLKTHRALLGSSCWSWRILICGKSTEEGILSSCNCVHQLPPWSLLFQCFSTDRWTEKLLIFQWSYCEKWTTKTWEKASSLSRREHHPRPHVLILCALVLVKISTLMASSDHIEMKGITSMGCCFFSVLFLCFSPRKKRVSLLYFPAEDPLVELANNISVANPHDILSFAFPWRCCSELANIISVLWIPTCSCVLLLIPLSRLFSCCCCLRCSIAWNLPCFFHASKNSAGVSFDS